MTFLLAYNEDIISNIFIPKAVRKQRREEQREKEAERKQRERNVASPRLIPWIDPWQSTINPNKSNIQLRELRKLEARDAIIQGLLCAAIKKKDVDAVRKLLAEDGADPSEPAMLLAAEGGNAAIVKLLLEKEPKLHFGKSREPALQVGTALQVATQKGHTEVVGLLTKHHERFPATIPWSSTIFELERF